MHFYAWIILITLLIGLGMVLKRAWLARQQNELVPETSAGASAEMPVDAPEAQGGFFGFTSQVTNSLHTRIQGLRNGFGGKEQVDIPTQFRNWATITFVSEPELQEWMSVLTDEQIGALAEHLAEFCRDMGFELSWLLDNQSVQNPELMAQLGQIALLYSRASYQAVTLQEEVEIYRIYHDLVQDPKSRPNRELAEHLFGKLVEQGMSDITISAHLAASARKRQQQILETIEQAAHEYPQIFNSILRTVLIERTMPEGMAESVAANDMTNGLAEAKNGTNKVSNGVAKTANGTTAPVLAAGD